MPKIAKTKEFDLYPIVQKWMMKYFRCFKSGTNIGLRYSRVDVLGIRDIGGDLTGEVETIAIEVKRHAGLFATTSGQAAGYQVYANRVYLAAITEPDGFKRSELEIANHLGIGLIGIKNGNCQEVLSSPVRHPITRMSMELIECMALGKCQLCGTFFEIGDAERGGNRRSRVSRESIDRASENDKGMMFWNRELGERKNKHGLRLTKNGSTFERRYICPDCVQYVLAPLRVQA
jgi:hypothetical protein